MEQKIVKRYGKTDTSIREKTAAQRVQIDGEAFSREIADASFYSLSPNIEGRITDERRKISV